MIKHKEIKKIKSIKVKDFNLEHTIECGQFFRYNLINGWYYVNYRGKLFKVRQQGNKLCYENVDKKFLVWFFALDLNYKKIIKLINKDKYIAPAIKKYYGMRVIRQDPWECLISYICSANSNIAKTKLNLELLSKMFGKPIKLNNYQSYTFPDLGELNSFSKIKKCKTGFRAKYIFEANKKISCKFFERLRKLNYDEAKRQLMQLSGVAHKVADCVLLFSLDKLNAYPVDVWAKRVFLNFYNKTIKQPPKITQYMQDYFGGYAGYAQEFLFYYYRKK